MNWENFNKQFREKLEYIPEEYDSAEWARFNKKNSPNKKMWGNFGYKFFLKIAASIVITSFVFISYAQFKKYSNILLKLEETENQNKKLTSLNKNFELKISEILKQNDSLIAQNEQYLTKINELKGLDQSNSLNKTRKIVKGKKKIKIKVAKPAKIDSVKKDRFFNKLIKGFKGLFKGKKSNKIDSLEVDVDSIGVEN